MHSRRFLLLVAVLVTVNAALWLASGAFGLNQTSTSSLFGPNMVRGDVTVLRGCPAACVEWRLDRGTVVSNTGGVLTVSEADTRTQAIAVGPSTKVTWLGMSAKLNGIRPGWRVLVQWPALGGPAQSVVIERRSRSSSGGGGNSTH